ncbi:amidase [Streptococcus sp. sy004]|uniref:amidase n=1 Tax=Streptococcus sp. sy004 TaxID=2600149 RepID=UPI0037D99D6A
MLEKMDATGLAEKVRLKEISPRELVEYSIDKIEKLNPSLNAVTSKRYEKALFEAETRDFTNKAFAGVPILLKDLGQEQVEEPSSSGSKLFVNYRAKLSDNYVKRLENLGFVILGRTNTPEFGFKNISDSQFNGRVNLPMDLSRNSGGSSGGAGAAVASGIVSLAGASDGGGSIRIPASFNGLIGLKTSRGRIPVGPSSFRGWQGLSVNFALTKSVRDTKRLLAGLQVCQLDSPFPLPLLSQDSLNSSFPKGLKIAVQKNSPVYSSVSDSAKKAVDKLAHFLATQGHDVIELDNLPVDGLEAISSYYVMNSVETAAMFDDIEMLLGRSVTKSDMELMTWAIYQTGKGVKAKDYSKLIQLWDRYTYLMEEFHQEYDLIISPATADVAPKHNQLDLSESLIESLNHITDYNQKQQEELIVEMFAPSLALTPFNQLANITGQPSISLPVYRTASGLPLGVQVTAAKGREDLLLALAQLLEDRELLRYSNEIK